MPDDDTPPWGNRSTEADRSLVTLTSWSGVAALLTRYICIGAEPPSAQLRSDGADTATARKAMVPTWASAPSTTGTISAVLVT